MLSVEIIKVIILVSLLVLTFTFSMIPLKLIRFINRNHDDERRNTYRCGLSLLNCFAAGVFLGTCLLDLFPDVRDKMTSSVERSGVVTTYPISEFTLVFGLFLVFIIEQIVLHSKELHELCLQENPSQRRLLDSGGSGGRTYRRIGNYHSVNGETDTETDGGPGGSGLRRSVSRESDEEEDHRSLQGSLAEDANTHSSIRSVILVTALSLHSVFEGLAVGLQRDYTKVIEIIAAITLHKSVLAFSLGLNLSQSRLTLRGVIQSNLAFAVTSPIGIGIGMAVVDLAPDNYVTDLINGILQGLACGTFLYVVFLEILPSEFMGQHSPADRMLRTLCFVLGYSTVALLLMLEPGVIRPVADSA